MREQLKRRNLRGGHGARRHHAEARSLGEAEKPALRHNAPVQSDLCDVRHTAVAQVGDISVRHSHRSVVAKSIAHPCVRNQLTAIFFLVQGCLRILLWPRRTRKSDGPSFYLTSKRVANA